MLNVGVVPAHDTLMEEFKRKEKIEKALKKIPPNHPMVAKFNK